MVSFRDIVNGLKELRMGSNPLVLAHASLSSFGQVRGGAEIVVGGLTAVCGPLVMPAFTFKTMVTPEEGPANNGISYGSQKDANCMAEFFEAKTMPVDPMIGRVAETLRKHPRASRSGHPVLSFCGLHAEDILERQRLGDPLAPIGEIAGRGGWVLLMGVDHTANTSIHYAERLAGRKQFVRWALTPPGVVECPGFPGCSDGFDKASAWLDGITRRTRIGDADIMALPLQPMLELVQNLVTRDPFALLCERQDCERCNAVRGVSLRV